MLNKNPFLVILLFILGLLSGCGILKKQEVSTETAQKQFENTITEKYWKLIELQGQKLIPDSNQISEIYFMLKTTENRVSGFGGCNSFFGTYELMEGNRIRLSNLGSTKMACLAMETENKFFEILQTADNYTLSGDTLCLNKAKMAPMAVFEAVYFN